MPLLEQRWQDSRVTLATLLGEPVQHLPANRGTIGALQWPRIGSGVPSDLLGRRPDIAAAETRLAAASANVQVARAALLPKLTLGADLGSGARTFAQILDSPYYTLTSGLIAPVFNNGRLRAARDLATAEQQELLENYRTSILASFADVEKALNAIQGVDHQRQWQDEEVRQARIAFDLAQQRYAAGAETLLSVLQTQRTLYDAQDQQAQLRLARLQGSVALYKALGVAGRCLRAEGHRGRNAAPGHRSGHDVLQRKMPRIPGPARHPPHQIADRIILAKGDAQRQFHDLDIHLHRLAGTRARNRAATMGVRPQPGVIDLYPAPWREPVHTVDLHTPHLAWVVALRARYQSSIRSSIQPWKPQNTGFTWEENGSPRKSFSGPNQRRAKSAGSRAKGTGAPLSGSRGTEAQHMCSQSCRVISISDPSAPRLSFARYRGSWYCDSQTGSYCKTSRWP